MSTMDDRLHRLKHHRRGSRFSDGRFVYGSNRGHDSVTIFARQSQGLFGSVVGWQPDPRQRARVSWPRPSPGIFSTRAKRQGDTVVHVRKVDGSSWQG